MPTSNPTPQRFFGKGYSLAANLLRFPSATLANGTNISTFSVDTGTGVVTVGAAHALVPGDIVRYSSSSSLPTGISASTDYFVLTTPTTTTFTFAATKTGPAIIPSTAGSGTLHVNVVGPLTEITDAEADPATGDYRRVVYGILEMINRKFQQVSPVPTKLSISRSSYEDSLTSELVLTYTVQIRTVISGVEVAEE